LTEERERGKETEEIEIHPADQHFQENSSIKIKEKPLN
jgi:hypothetical protein